MMAVTRTIVDRWMLAAVSVVGVVFSPVLTGFAPVGGDPELLYQPIKAELGRALSAGELPFWSDRLGLGVPLVAESHVAAFYPPNWLLYRLLSTGSAYRLSLWLHMVGLAAATFAYARTLGVGEPGAALAAVSFALCGFQAIHDVHEPFYCQLPYLPLCLLLADRYATTGRLPWLAGLAVTSGTQITLGHFQIQMWTAGLVLLAGGYRALMGLGDQGRPSRPWRIIGLAVGLGWGAAIAWVQLRLTWELTQVAGFVRPAPYAALWWFPPVHLAQFALPEVFLGRPLGAGDAYWGHLGTTSREACAYVGIVPLILAFVGFFAAPRDRSLTAWRLIGPLSLVVATMPGWWPDGYFLIMQLPGLGWFRAPARYTLLTSFALALLAGRGLERTLAPSRVRVGLALALLVGASAWGWSIHRAHDIEFRAGLGANTLPLRFAAAGLAWGAGLIAVAAWRRNWVGAWAPLLLTALELAPLLFLGPVVWGWAVRLPEKSPMLRRLAVEPGVGLVGGRLNNLPVDAGQATAYPTLGIVPPPPNYLLESAVALSLGQTNPKEARWHRRFGVTHGVWGIGDDVRGTEVLAVIDDPALDRVLGSVPGLPGRGPWKLVRYRDVFPPAWIALRVRQAENWVRLYRALSGSDAQDEAWLLPEDRPSRLRNLDASPASHVTNWDGRTAVVEHDGSCVLILRRTHYPGWTYRVDGGPEQPVLKVSGGLQGAWLAGSGTSRVETRYRPTGLTRTASVSFSSLVAALLVLAVAGRSSLKRRSQLSD
jgi:hypothetical protein